MKGPTTPAARIDAILAALPTDQREAIQHLRETISSAVPEAEEAISYGAPADRSPHRPPVAYNAYKAHCSFFPMDPKLIERHRDSLTGFTVAKGTLRFTPEHPIPDASSN